VKTPRDSIVGHHWSIIGLLSFSVTLGRYLCWPMLMRLIPGQHNPFLWVAEPNGAIVQATFWEAVLPLVYQMAEFLHQAPCEWWPMHIFVKLLSSNPY